MGGRRGGPDQPTPTYRGECASHPDSHQHQPDCLLVALLWSRKNAAYGGVGWRGGRVMRWGVRVMRLGAAGRGGEVGQGGVECGGG